MLVLASSPRTTSRLGASMMSLSAPPASIGKRTAPPPTVKLVTRSGAFAARKRAAAVPTSGPTTCGAPRSHSSIRRARNAPEASGAISSERPSEWPKPGMSMATARPTAETRSQMRRKAHRLSGHGASSRTVTSESALVSANLIRERGIHGTGLREVAAHSGGPRGSLGRFFPGGKTQLVIEAIDVALVDLFGDLERTLNEAETLPEAISVIVAPWRRLLVEHDFTLGCPLAATTCDAAAHDRL